MSGSACFVLVRLGDQQAGTLPAMDAEPLIRTVRGYGGVCSVKEDASLVGRFDGDGADMALVSAQCALDLRSLAPRAPMLVGRVPSAEAEVDHPRARVVDAAFRDILLQRPDCAPILLDDALEPLIQREFETTRELGLAWLVSRASAQSRATHVSGVERASSDSLGTVRGSLAAIRRADIPSPALPDPLVGRTLGDFILRERLGQGGFGVVYLAEQPALDRQAVVKILRRGSKTDAETVPRFLRESRLASRLDHPYAAHIYAFGAEPDGVMWIAMELVRGATLAELLKTQGSIGLDRFVPLLGLICEVVQTAHDQGIIHRDLKPLNIMAISRAGRLLPKLLDFGIARGAFPPTAITHEASDPDPLAVAAADVPAATTGTSSPVDPSGWSAAPASHLSNVMTSDAITGEGTAVGSPPYMAPEQWRGEATSPATDQYALGVLCYEVLTGDRPFRGDQQRLSRLHRSAPPPALGPGFPPALDDVLRRAMAKPAADRYPSVLEFAAAFRVAAGLTTAPGEPEVPQLSEAVREVALVHAPGPIADAVAALDAAPTSVKAWVGLRAVAGAVARYLGVLALAARGRIGPGAAEDEPQILELARRLRTSALADEEWVELARRLTRFFAGRASVHPLPELVELLWGASGEAGATELDHVLSLAAAPAGDAATDVARAELEKTLPALERLLRACDPLWKYALAVGEADGERVQLWVGARRHRRATRRPLTRIEENEVIVVDADGALVVSLHPIVQCLPPAPGQAPELFFLQGAGRFGARLTTLPGDLERHDDEPWAWLEKTISGVGAGGPAAEEDEDAPYLGLRPFTVADSSRFFGREREVEAALNRLKQEPFLALVGASGAGKSSFIQAGMLPSLGARWTAITARPGATPTAQLAAQLDAHQIDGHGLRDPDGHPEALAEALRMAARTTGRHILLAIDQFEEILTMCRDEGERGRYLEALVRCARSADDPVRLVITLRDDFLIRVQEQPALRDRIGPALQLLGTPQPDDLVRILVEPLARRGYQFEDQALIDTMVSAVAYQPGALALLSFTGARLWDLRDRHFRHLTHKAYETLGGVGGALAQHAEELLGAMSPAEQALAREVFRHLVSAEGTRAVMSSRELADVLGGGDDGPRVVQRLIQGRLLVASEGDAAQDHVEVVHEALLTQWPRLVTWQREDADGARMRDQLRAAARLWDERGRPRGALWLGDALLEYRVWRGRYSGGLTAAEDAFARASLHEEARGRRRRRVVTAIAFAALCTGLFFLYRINQRTEAQRGRAEAFSADAQRRIQMLYEEQARQGYLAGEPMRALAYASEAYRRDPRSPTVRFLVARVSEALRGQQLVVGDATGGPSMAGAFDPKGKRFVASQGAVLHMWDLETGAERWSATGHEQSIWTVEFSADGALVVTGALDGTARVWDAETGRAIQTLTHGQPFAQRFPESANACPSADEPRVFFTRFTPEGSLLTGGYDGTIRLWDPRSGALLASHDFNLWVSRAAYDPGSRTVAVGSRIGHLFLWELASDTITLAERPHRDNIGFLEFSPDGSRLLVGSWDATATVWTVRPPHLVKKMLDHDIDVFAGGFSPDGRQFVTASTDETAKLWDAATGTQLRSLRGRAGGLTSAAYLPDGHRVVTTGRDGSVQVWAADTGDTLWEFLGHTGVIRAVAVDPSGTHLLTTSFDGSARVWDLTLTRWASQLAGHRGNVRGSEVAPSSREVATAGEDGTVRLWKPDGTPIRTIDAGTPLNSVSWSVDGKRLVAAGDASAVVLDAADGRVLAKMAPGGILHDAAFVGASDRVVTAGEDGVVRMWDGAGRPIRSFTGHEGAVFRARLDDRGARLVTVGRDTTVRVWDVASGALRHTLRGHHDEVHGLDVSADGSRAWTSGWDADARLWDLDAGAPIATISDRGNSIISLELSTDGKFLLTGGEEGFIRVWEAASGLMLESVPLWGCQSIDLSPDGEFFVFTGRDGVARTMRSGLERRPIDEIARLARCRSPYKLEGEKLAERPTDPAVCAALRPAARP